MLFTCSISFAPMLSVRYGDVILGDGSSWYWSWYWSPSLAEQVKNMVPVDSGGAEGRGGGEEGIARLAVRQSAMTFLSVMLGMTAVLSSRAFVSGDVCRTRNHSLIMARS